MDETLPSKRRLIAVAIISVAILLVIVLLTGNQTLSSPSGAAQITALPPTYPPAASTPAPSSGKVQGAVSVAATHLSGHTWRFRYTVRATGKTPIAGFQLSGPTAHLFRVTGPGWNFYGNGVCGSSGPSGLLIYWSTGQASPDVIRPGTSATFGFEVNTSGPATASYAISYGTSTPSFGQIRGPATSSLPVTGLCK
jgi:hypothetical protein